MNYSEYVKEREIKKVYWTKYALEKLDDPRATRSECRCAAIGVQSFDPDLAEALSTKKCRTPKSY